MTAQAQELTLVVRAQQLGATHTALRIIHVHPSGHIDFLDHNANEVTFHPASPHIHSHTRTLTIHLAAQHSQQEGHLYAVVIHSEPPVLTFKDLTLEVQASGQASYGGPLRLPDHVALLGVWWQDQRGTWAFEESREALGREQPEQRALLLTGRYLERLAGR